MSARSSAGDSPSKHTSSPTVPDGDDQEGHSLPDTETPGNAGVVPVVPAAASTTSPLQSPQLEGSAGKADDAVDDSQPGSSQANVSRTGLLSSDEVIQRVRARILPDRDQGSPSNSNTLPAHHTHPPPRTLVGDSFIIGVPAHASAYRNGSYVREGYGGVKALMLFDGLSESDVQDLCSLVGDSAEVRQMVLRPYHDQQAPNLDALETTLNSLMARREFASLIMHVSPLELAQRVFYTVSLLHRVLVWDRQRQRIIQDMDVNSVARRLLCLQGEHDRLKKDFVFLYEYHQQEVQSVQSEAASTRCLLETDFARLARENLEETAALRQRVGDIESQLRYSQTQIASLKRQVRESKFDADGLLSFLNGGSNEVRGNWPRFRRLLGQFRRGVSPPSSWKTWITVEAADKAFRMIPPYPGPAPPDSDADDDDDAEQEEKCEDNPPSSACSPSLSSDDSGRQSKSKRRSSSGRVQSSEIQHRPAVHPESNVGPRAASDVLPYTVREACALLPEFIV
ncbi:hypothetical protein PR003_g19912 [Phytophthora rubi]|uniref:Uncharacterized protein n=1 Tax=Phytophthora rubi TaxID=129364 RepID=A0A6A4DP14_9STRA|nr:hypothetical protein PR001_g17691 [Phytophthora rubi]KAE9311862.1 hypothetical protein PR003_g19912 [Phytophthora rubi]